MEKLYLGIGRRVITPEIGARLFGYQDNVYSKSVNDDLHTTAYVFRQKDALSAIISVSVCLIDTPMTKNIREKIEAEANIPYSNILIATTHTHSGPYTASGPAVGTLNESEAEYCSTVLVPGIVGAVTDALSNMDEVTVGCSVGESYAAVNRREVTEDGRIKLGQNPSGQFDPKMTLISFKKANGEIKGTLIHYGMHGTASGMNTEITEDWCGVMTRRIEEISGAPCAFLNGPEGDVGPRLSNGRTAGNIELMREIGEVAARDAVRIYDGLSDFKSANIEFLKANVKIPVKPRLPLSFCKDELEKYMQERLVSIGVYWKRHYQRVLDSYKNGYEEKEYFEDEQTVVRLGDVIIVATPYELFSEIGLKIQKGYDGFKVLTLSNTNGSSGYFPTEKDVPLFGYETHSFRTRLIQPFVDNADYYFIEETKKNIDKLISKEN